MTGDRGGAYLPGAHRRVSASIGECLACLGGHCEGRTGDDGGEGGVVGVN